MKPPSEARCSPSCCLLDVFPDGLSESFIERDAISLGVANQMLRPSFWHFDCGPEFAIRPQIDDLHVFFAAFGCLHSHRRRVNSAACKSYFPSEKIETEQFCESIGNVFRT